MVGECYENSCRIVARCHPAGVPGHVPDEVWEQFAALLTPESKVYLIHGSVLTQRYGSVTRINHAWVEVRNPGQAVQCFHWQLGTLAGVCGRRVTDRTHRRYTVEQAMIEMLTFATYGPWPSRRANGSPGQERVGDPTGASA
jgi:hypothetical protein